MTFNPAYVGYWDADLATPLETILQFLQIARDRPELGIIMGSRVRRLGADIRRGAARHYLGRLFATVASWILKIPVYDTQCGAKIIKADLARKIFKEPFVSKWIFDVELLARAKGSAILELPLDKWTDVSGSKLVAGHYFAALRDMARIWQKYGGMK